MSDDISKPLFPDEMSQPGRVHVVCPCGRRLRIEGGGGVEVRCWSCGRNVVVPKVYTRRQLYATLAVHFRESFRPSRIGTALVLGLATSLILTAPQIGLWLAIVPVIAAGAWYCRTIRRVGVRGTSESGRVGLRTWIVWVILGGMGGIGFVLPGYLLFGGYNRVMLSLAANPDPHPEATLALINWLAWPLILTAVSATGGTRVTGLWRTIRALAGRPLATLGALLIVPLGLCFIELALAGFGWYYDWLGFFVNDLVPFRATYSQALRHGYFLFVDLPFSLPRPHKESLRVLPPVISLTDPAIFYKVLRVSLSSVSLGGIFVALMIQARWLGVLATWPLRQKTTVRPISATIPADGQEPGIADIVSFPAVPEGPDVSVALTTATGAVLSTRADSQHEVDDSSTEVVVAMSSPIGPRLVEIVEELARELGQARDDLLDNRHKGAAALHPIVMGIAGRSRALADEFSAAMVAELVAKTGRTIRLIDDSVEIEVPKELVAAAQDHSPDGPDGNGRLASADTSPAESPPA